MESFLDASGKEYHTICRFGRKLREIDHFPTIARRNQKGNPVTFPMKLMILLNEDPDPSAITWLPDGRSFIVKNQEKFAKEICPKYFSSTRYVSFQRLLKVWGFKRFTTKREVRGYNSPFFLKGNPALVRKMKFTKT